MIKIENLTTSGWEAAIRGMRNPLNSWQKSDSGPMVIQTADGAEFKQFGLGPNDMDLACRLIAAGPEHAKFLRMIHVSMDITAPLYFWKEAEQYKVATTTNSCSTMHQIHSRDLTLDDFSHEHLTHYAKDGELYRDWLADLEETIDDINFARKKYLETKDKKYWWQMIQLLPSSYNQLRTWDGSLAAILNIIHQRKNHKLDEWHTFCDYCLENIPYCQEFYNAMTKEAQSNA